MNKERIELPVITFDNVSKHYGEGEGQICALKNVSLRFEGGEFVVVCGPSGSGKSTLLHIMGLLDRPSEGIYRFAGEDVTELSDRERSKLRNKTIGFVFQGFHLLPKLTALQNVCLPLLYGGNRSDVRKRAEKALCEVSLEHRINQRCGKLSGGEKQRVAIARALVKEPEVILADEPTGNLDTGSGERILELLSSINQKGVTLVMVTHNSEITELAKRVVYTVDGVCTEERPAEK